MPDWERYRLDELVTCWRISHRGFRKTIRKTDPVQSIKIQLLEFHVLVTKSLQSRK